MGRSRIILGTDVRVIRKDGRWWSTNPSLSGEYLRRFSKLKVTLVLVARQSVDAETAVLPLPTNIEVHPLHDGGRRGGLVQTLMQIARVHVDAGDIVYCRVPEVVGLALFFVGRLHRSATVVHVVAATDSWFRGRGWPQLAARQALETVTRIVVQSADRVVYVTSRSMQQRYPTKAPSVQISNVALPAWWAPTKPIPNNEYFTISSVGSLDSEAKGFDVLIDAVGELDEATSIRVRIAGGGDGNWLLRRSARSRLASLDLLGMVGDRTEMYGILATSDLFILASRTEGLPRAMLEAIAAGVPAIGTDVGGISELVPQEYVVPAGDARALAGLIRTLIRDPQQLDALAQLQRSTVADVLQSASPETMCDFLGPVVERNL